MIVLPKTAIIVFDRPRGRSFRVGKRAAVVGIAFNNEINGLLTDGRLNFIKAIIGSNKHPGLIRLVRRISWIKYEVQ